MDDYGGGVDWANAPDQSAAETARLGRQDAFLGNAQRNQALIKALREMQIQAPQGRMVGKFYVPGNTTAQMLSAGSNIAGSFMGGGGGGGYFGGM